jgi:hypothetical protein
MLKRNTFIPAIWLLVLLFLVLPALAQVVVDTAWVRRYNGPANSHDEACAIAVDASGNVYVTGSRGIYEQSDYVTIKYDSSGNQLWVKTYNGPGDSGDEPFAMAIDGQSSVYVTGRSKGSGTDYDYATIKYYPNGDTAWVRRYNGPGNYEDKANAIAVDDSGNVYVTGWGSDGGWYSSDYATIKYYPNGDTAWVRRYTGAQGVYEVAYAICVDGLGNAYVTGKALGGYGTIKYYPNGDTAWVRVYTGPGYGGDIAYAICVDREDYANALALDILGNVYVTGSSYGVGLTTALDYATIKYCPNGDTGWIRRYNGPGDFYDNCWDIAVDSSNNVYITGGSYGSGTSMDYATIKYYQHNNPPNPFLLLFPPNKAFTPRGVHFDWETATDPNPCDQVTYDLYVSTSYRFHPDSTELNGNLTESEYFKTLDYGRYYWKVRARDNYGADTWSSQTRSFIVSGIPYSSGDFNGDGQTNSEDVVYGINYLFRNGPTPDPLETGDCNCDGSVGPGDVVYLLNYLFRGGPPPSC